MSSFIALSEIILKGSHINGDVISGIFDSGDTSSIISSTVDVEGEDFVGFYGLTVETNDSDIKLDDVEQNDTRWRDNYTIDADKIESLITDKTSAVI